MDLYYYTLFNLQPNFTQAELKCSFYAVMKEMEDYHANEAMKTMCYNEILDAYNTLSNDEKRKKYDFAVELKALMIYEQLLSLLKIMKQVVYWQQNDQYEKISISQKMIIKKTLTYVFDVLDTNEDVDVYLADHYSDLVEEFADTKEKYLI